MMKNRIQHLLGALGYSLHRKRTIESMMQEADGLRRTVAELRTHATSWASDNPTEWPVSPEFNAAGLAGAALEKLIRDYDFHSVVDIGAGAQAHAAIFARFGKQVTAVDLGASEFHRQKVTREGSGISEVLGDFNLMEFPGQFDCVWASHVLEHQLNAGMFLAKVVSVLKEGGVLAITVPPPKNEIVGGHVSLWNAGLLLYRLVLAGIDCRNAQVLAYGYNISVIVTKKSIGERVDLGLEYDRGDIRKIRRFLPEGLCYNSNAVDDPFDGDIRILNWAPPKNPQSATSILEPEPLKPGPTPGLGEEHSGEGSTQNFYAFDLESRKRMVEDAIGDRKTLISRWENLAAESTASWSSRAECAAKLLGSPSSVADLGCGMMTLEQFLDATTSYIPVDVVRRDSRTHVVDLNRQPLPDFDAECFVGLGLIEYVFDVPTLLSRISDIHDSGVISYNSIDHHPDRSERTGHAWVNHFTVAEIETIFADCGLQIEQRIQFDATQTLWKLTSLKRHRSPVGCSTATASRIVFTCDFMRTDDAMVFNQRHNLKKIFGLMSSRIRSASDIPVHQFPDVSDGDYRSLVMSAFRAFDLQPSMRSWARTYNESSLDDSPEAEERMYELLVPVFRGAIVIAFEVSPMLRKVLQRCAVAWIDVRAHSQRFGDDLPLAFQSNSRTAMEVLKAYAYPSDRFRKSGEELRAKMQAAPSDIRQPCVAFLAQTHQDSSVIMPNGEFFDVRPRLEEIQHIVYSYGTDLLFVKPHPLEPSGTVVRALMSIPQAEVVSENVYRLMVSEQVLAFITYSSSSGHEAEAFGKTVHWLSPMQPIRSYLPIMFEYRTAGFWHTLLDALSVPVRADLPEETIRFERDYLRRLFSINWDARSQL